MPAIRHPQRSCFLAPAFAESGDGTEVEDFLDGIRIRISGNDQRDLIRYCDKTQHSLPRNITTRFCVPKGKNECLRPSDLTKIVSILPGCLADFPFERDAEVFGMFETGQCCDLG